MTDIDLGNMVHQELEETLGILQNAQPFAVRVTGLYNKPFWSQCAPREGTNTLYLIINP